MPAFQSLPLPDVGASRAPWPVWSNSVRKAVRFAQISKREASRLYHAARRFERQTRCYGRQDGALGRNGLLVLHALIFDFLNFKTGRLDPSIATIARAANISVSSVKRGLVRLKAAGVISWLRRCAECWVDGQFQLRQQSNAYSVRPATQWLGYALPQESPAPFPAAWGASPPLPDALDLASREKNAWAMVAALQSDPGNALAAKLAALGRSVLGRRNG